jgi:acetylornithine deacetylase/succinyl-diaminopimelate desuccinylase-like protein
MIFCASARGLSHTPEEDSSEEALRLGIESLALATAEVAAQGV